MGWKVIYEAAVRTDADGTSGVTAVLARSVFGLRRAGRWPEAIRHRGATAFVEISASTVIHIVSAYLVASEGWSVANQAIARQIAVPVGAACAPTIVGADWNIAP